MYKKLYLYNYYFRNTIVEYDRQIKELVPFNIFKYWYALMHYLNSKQLFKKILIGGPI